MMSDGFNYGGEVAEIDSHFKVWPTDGNMTGAVDADLLPYRIGHIIAAHYSLSYTQAEFAVNEGHYPSLRDTPQYAEAWEMLCKELNSWVTGAGCDAAVLFVTNSASNFRLDIAFTEDYKGQRNPEKPPYFYELKEDLVTRLGAIVSDGEEADDLMSIFVYDKAKELGVHPGTPEHREFCNTVVISTDKDSTITGGLHFDPVKMVKRFIDKFGTLEPKYKIKEVNDYATWPLFNGEPVDPATCTVQGKLWYKGGVVCDQFGRGAKVGLPKTKRMLLGRKESASIDDLKGSGLKFFYAQIIMGDSADNYNGIPGKGCTFAFNLLDGCKTEEELYKAVLGAYKDHYGTGKHLALNYRGTQQELTAYQRMLEQGRLAWMQTYKGEIWRSTSTCPTGVDASWNA
ncbi:exonuclease-like protein [Pseudomonas phage Njord]|uniref:Exonuclease-like protein n=1 Tax=Pseudomonas phage Njord TaxID=2163985 RepID=A0A2S1GMJ4_9CAUD|nr:exonuclease [Pseudomonas phage Njord]AWD90605.1 exonuclease-like protein [Pseudomonas phage Njord]